MIHERINIWDGFTNPNKLKNTYEPYMDTYILDGDKKRDAVLILPGGAYYFTSDREAEPIAAKYNAAGFNAFVLYYSVVPSKYPQSLLDTARSMSIIKENAEKWHINKIAVCGFSAGGHLAASLGEYWDKPFLFKIPGIEKNDTRPDAVILNYPVITSGKFTHKESIINLIGENPDSSLLDEVSLEKHVSKNTPPCFIWATFEDGAVPVENSMLFAQALRKAGVEFELHIYPKGGHGLSLATKETDSDNPHVSTWMNLSIEWLNIVLNSK